MKKGMLRKSNPSTFYIVLIAIGLIILFGCIFGYFCWRSNARERFQSGCLSEENYDDKYYANQRFFHYNNTGKLVSSDPIHVNQQTVKQVMYDLDNSGGGKKKSQLSKLLD